MFLACILELNIYFLRYEVYVRVLFGLHEWSIAESIVVSSAKIAVEQGASKVVKVYVRVGELSQLELEILKTAINELKREYDVVKDAEFIFEVEEACCKCLSCGYSWGFSEVKRKINEIFCGSPNIECDNPIHYVPDLVNSFIRCPKCGSPDFEVVAGRGVYIARMDFVK